MVANSILDADSSVSTPLKLEKLPQIQSRVPFGKAHIYALIRDGKFPSPIKIGRASFWDSSAIDDWIKEHIKRNMSQQGGRL